MGKEEHDFGSGKKTSRNERVLVIFLLLLGILIGAILSMQFAFPEMNQTIMKENQALKEKNTLLEKEADSLVNCMQKSGINYYLDCK